MMRHEARPTGAEDAGGTDEESGAEAFRRDLAAPAARRVVVALELDRPEDAKVGVGVAQARALGATLALLHVLPSGDVVAEARARKALAETARRLRAATAGSAGSVAVETVVRRGPVAPTIVAELERPDTALGILGSSVRRTLARPALGDIADRVVSAASRPVLFVRSDEAAARSGAAA